MVHKYIDFLLIFRGEMRCGHVSEIHPFSSQKKHGVSLLGLDNVQNTWTIVLYVTLLFC